MKVKNISRRPGSGPQGPVRRPDKPNEIACGNCRRDVPRSAAISAEGEDYALHFCGLKCYRQWLATHKQYRRASGR